MVAALERNHAGAPRRLAREPQRALDGLGARGREEEAVEAERVRLEALDQLEHAVMVRDRHLEVTRLRGLRLHRRDDTRVAVARRGHADAGGEI